MALSPNRFVGSLIRPAASATDRGRQARAWAQVLALAACLGPFAPAEQVRAAPTLLDVQQAAFYSGVTDLPLEERIHPAPPGVLHLLWQRNLGNGVDLMPRAAAPQHPLRPMLARMLRELPSPVKQLAERFVAAIFLVEDNFGSARAEAVWDGQGNIVGGYLALNLSAVMRPANTWITWRENSAFRTTEGPSIQVALEPPDSDTVASTLRFIFLHELGHIVGIAMRAHGFWAAPETLWLTARSAFARLSWIPAQGALLSPWKQRYPVLAQPRFYRFEDSPLPRSAAPAIYAALAQSNLPSLYGSIDPYEDFAESFAVFVHTRLLKRSYRVDLHASGKLVGQYFSCLETGHCPQKRVFFEALIGGEKPRSHEPAAPTRMP